MGFKRLNGSRNGRLESSRVGVGGFNGSRIWGSEGLRVLVWEVVDVGWFSGGGLEGSRVRGQWV